jgi:hypothetical protein
MLDQSITGFDPNRTSGPAILAADLAVICLLAGYQFSHHSARGCDLSFQQKIEHAIIDWRRPTRIRVVVSSLISNQLAH